MNGRLDNWSVIFKNVPRGRYSLVGFLSDDPEERWAEGDIVVTSSIDASDFPPETLVAGGVVETRNSIYLLGAALPTEGE